jgi:hypothetical protein
MWFRLSSLPQLQHLSPEQRKVLLAQVGAGKIVRGIIFRAVAMGVLAGLVASSIVGSMTNRSDLLSALGFVVGAAVVGFAVYGWLLIRVHGQLIQYFAQIRKEQRLPVCIKCGYDLEGSQAKTCPECGAFVGDDSREK